MHYNLPSRSIIPGVKSCSKVHRMKFTFALKSYDFAMVLHKINREVLSISKLSPA